MLVKSSRTALIATVTASTSAMTLEVLDDERADKRLGTVKRFELAAGTC